MMRFSRLVRTTVATIIATSDTRATYSYRLPQGKRCADSPRRMTHAAWNSSPRKTTPWPNVPKRSTLSWRASSSAWLITGRSWATRPHNERAREPPRLDESAEVVEAASSVPVPAPTLTDATPVFDADAPCSTPDSDASDATPDFVALAPTSSLSEAAWAP